MNPSLVEEGMRWLLQAKHDMDDARYAAEGNRFNLACFLAQHAAEKALKGYLYGKGRSLILAHSVARLCQAATESDAAFDSLRARAAPLDKYYIPTRYPNGLPGGIPSEAFDQIDAMRALELGEEVIQFVEKRLPLKEENASDAQGEGHA